jgi:hypothetical protein
MVGLKLTVSHQRRDLGPIAHELTPDSDGGLVGQTLAWAAAGGDWSFTTGVAVSLHGLCFGFTAARTICPGLAHSSALCPVMLRAYSSVSPTAMSAFRQASHGRVAGPRCRRRPPARDCRIGPAGRAGIPPIWAERLNRIERIVQPALCGRARHELGEELVRQAVRDHRGFDHLAEGRQAGGSHGVAPLTGASSPMLDLRGEPSVGYHARSGCSAGWATQLRDPKREPEHDGEACRLHASPDAICARHLDTVRGVVDIEHAKANTRLIRKRFRFR